MTILLFGIGIMALSSRCFAIEDDSKIIGGFNVQMNNAPFVASLQYQGSHFCGGSLVTLSHVLTGCHCLTNIQSGMRNSDLSFWTTKALTVVVGSENIVQPNTSKYYQWRDVTDIDIHPRCSYVKILVYDFALAYLEHPLTKNAKVNPFKMYAYEKQPYDSKTKSLIGDKKVYCYVAGWGTTKPDVEKASPVLNAARMRAISDRECQTLLGNENKKFYDHSFDRNAAICTLSLDKSKNESDCVGDSGGPFFCGSTVYGVVSFGFECGQWNVPNVYAKVSYAVEWLISRNLFPDQRPKNKLRNLTTNEAYRSTQLYTAIAILAIVIKNFN